MLWSIYGTVNSVESGEFTGAVKYLLFIKKAEKNLQLDPFIWD